MAEKQRYTVSLPDHVTAELEKHAKAVGATPTEYAGDVIRWWFGQGAPAVRPDEAELRKRAIPNVWNLNPTARYTVHEDTIVEEIMHQLGVPNLFATAKEHDELRIMIAFDNHPTHWIVLNFYKGSTSKEGDGLSFDAYPKSSVPLRTMLSTLETETKKMRAKGPFEFSQIPSIKQGIELAAKSSQ